MQTIPNDFSVSAVFQKRLKELLPQNKSNLLLAKEIGISKDILIRAVNAGLIPGMRSLLRIADALQTSVDYLLALTDADEFIAAPAPVPFSARLEELKEAKGERDGTVAARIGISRSLFTVWRSGGHLPSVEIAYLLAKHFSVSVDYLFGRTDREQY